MTVKRLVLSILLAVGLVFPFLGSAMAAAPPAAPSAKYALYVPGGTTKLAGIPGAQVLPGNTVAWNGSLIVFAHGYTVPGSSQDSILAYLKGQLPVLAQIANGNGYALAASTYTRLGYAIKEGVADTRALASYLRSYVSYLGLPKVRYVYVVGVSEGGLIAVNLLEKYPSEFSGGFSGCGAVAGWEPMVQYDGDYRVLLDYFFGAKLTAGNPYPLGANALTVPPSLFAMWAGETALLDAGVPNAATPVHDFYFGLFYSNPAATKSLLDVARVAVDPSKVDVNAARAESAMRVLNYIILGTTDQIATSGGNPYDNNPRAYTDPTGSLSTSALAALNAGVERFDAVSSALAFVRTYYSPTDRLTRPLVTMHNQYDPDVPYRMEDAYRAKVPWYYRWNLVKVASQNASGHCNFTQGDMQNAFIRLVIRVEGFRLFATPVAANERINLAVGHR